MKVRVQKTLSAEIDIEIAKEAYKAYVRKYGHSQTFDRIIERGGFDWSEIAYHLYEQIQYLESNTGN
ncbi:hypothetical protein I5F10_17365 [Proteus mirabilis]|nr:hypothetical protein [Proteus mirabilis]MBG6049933.1 hypothetical protein [Proteus mirabilis]